MYQQLAGNARSSLERSGLGMGAFRRRFLEGNRVRIILPAFFTAVGVAN